MAGGKLSEWQKNVPQKRRHVLEKLGSLYHNDLLARARGLSTIEPLLFHQEHKCTGDDTIARAG